MVARIILVGQQILCRFANGIWIDWAQRCILVHRQLVRLHLSIDLIAASDHYQRILLEKQHRLKDGKLCKDIREQCASGILERLRYVGLCRKMEDDIWFYMIEERCHLFLNTQISTNELDLFTQLRECQARLAIQPPHLPITGSKQVFSQMTANKPIDTSNKRTHSSTIAES